MLDRRGPSLSGLPGALFVLLLPLLGCSEEPAADAGPVETFPAVEADPVELLPEAPPTDPGEAAPAPDARNPDWPTAFRLPDEVAPSYQRVVLVTIDTLRRDHVSAHGYLRPTTPFLDSLAERGVLFERAVSSVSHTAPAHTTMLTGLHPIEHGVRENGQRLPRAAVDIARVFDAARFRTGAFLNVRFLEGITGSFEEVGVKQMKGGPVVDDAIAWLSEKRWKQRFFVWVHLYDPHHWNKEVSLAARRLDELRAGTETDDLLGYLTDLHGLRFDANGDVVIGPDSDAGGGEVLSLTTEEYLAAIDRYDALIRYADDQLARLYHAIEGAELPGRTLWVVTSDHGEGIGSHEFKGHGGRIYQEQVAVPLVVHASDDSLETRRVTELVQHVDLFPTLAEIVGAELSGFDVAVEGASLWPLLRGEEGYPSRPAFSQRRPVDRSSGAEDLYTLQSQRHKFILRSLQEDEFFDLEADPGERTNRIGTDAAEAESLRRLLEGRLERYRQRGKTGGGDETEVPEEWLEELRALGYVE